MPLLAAFLGDVGGVDRVQDLEELAYVAGAVVV